MASERTYAIYRGPGARPDVIAIDRLGRIASGSFAGVRLGDLLRTASRQGWLAYRHRPDGWYSAEWYGERKSVAMCGPCALPGFTDAPLPAAEAA